MKINAMKITEKNLINIEIAADKGFEVINLGISSARVQCIKCGKTYQVSSQLKIDNHYEICQAESVIIEFEQIERETVEEIFARYEKEEVFVEFETKSERRAKMRALLVD